MRKMLGYVMIFLLLGLISPFFAYAHVVVTPSTVGIAKTQDFTVNVPNEKDNPIVSVRLLIPAGVTHVVPNVVPGWTVSTVPDSSGNNVTEIDWTDGSIPAGQRQEFIFQAQAPSTITTLSWKAYQTYSDGTIMSWDVNPSTLGKMSDAQQDALAEKQNKGVYSTTEVINDLAIPPNATVPQVQSVDQKATNALIFSIIAIAIGCVALSIIKRKMQDQLPPQKILKSSRTRKRAR